MLSVFLFCLLFKVSKHIGRCQEELGARNGSRALACSQQATFEPASVAVRTSAVYRYKDEEVDVLAVQAPSYARPWKRPLAGGVILGGILISFGRCAEKKASSRGKGIGKWYFEKAYEHVLIVSGGNILGHGGALPAVPTTSSPPACRSAWRCVPG